MGLFAFDGQYAMFDTTPVQNQFILEYMPSAKGEDVKVYLYGLMHCYHGGESLTLPQMARDLNLSDEEILKAYRHWERQGLVRRVSDNPASFQYVNVYQQFLSRDNTPRDVEYEEFAQSLCDLFGESRRLHGSETTMAYEWVEDMGLPREVVLMLLHYMITHHGKRFSFASAQKLAVEMAENNITTIEDAEEMFGREEKLEKGLKRLLRRLGRARQPSADERALYLKWVKEWGYTSEAIEAACAETTRGEPTMAYLDGILRGMRERAGKVLTTEKQVENFRRAEKDRAAPLKALLRVINSPGATVNEATLALFDEMRSLYPDEIILIAGRACAAAGGKLDDVMTTLQVWKRKGYSGAEEIRQSLALAEKQNAFLSALFSLWGCSTRPTAGDRAILSRWEKELGYGEEMILFCAPFAQGADKPMPYLNKLLTAYHAQGFTTPVQVQASRETHAARETQADGSGQQNANDAPARRGGKTVSEQQYTQRKYESGMTIPAWQLEEMERLNSDA